MLYQGSCHCGRISFEVEGDLEQVIESNCSMCHRRASLLWLVPRQQLRLLTPEQNLSTYTFNTHKIQHHFCDNCGIHTFGEGVGPAGNATAAVNTRCLENVDLTKLKVQHYDGRSH